MSCVTGGRAKRFTLGFMIASIVYWPGVWLVYDGPMIMMLPGMLGAGIVGGLLAVWRPPAKVTRPPA